MNRETKIGLVTGVTLIVLIGAMLSSYLSSPRRHIGDLSSVGQGRQLRQQISNPVGIAQVPVVNSPSASKAVTLTTQRLAAYTQPSSPYNQVTQLPYGLSASSNTVNAPNTPTVNPVVIPVAVKPIPAPGPAPATTNIPVTASAASYTVRPGDTLDKIAWHFYHDSGPIAVRRIVNANRGTLTSAQAILRVGETLNIPAANTQAASSLLTMVALTKSTAFASHRNKRNTSAPTADSVRMRTYRVQNGDTLWSIARKTMGAATESNVQRIMALNHIHNARTIAIGQILNIP